MNYSAQLSYEYDLNGNITQISKTENGVTSVIAKYTYDKANQLLSEEVPGQRKTEWAYDNAGNIQTRTDYTWTNGSWSDGAEVTYGYTDEAWGDKLTRYNNQDFDYDDGGNLIQDGTWVYSWQHGRQLASMVNADASVTWNYGYDADGLRTKRVHTANGSTTTWEYVYNGGQLVLMTKGGETLYFAYDATGTPMTVTHNNTVYYYATNLQGDIIAILNGNGVAVAEYTYDAWGNPVGTLPTTGIGALNPLRYRGYVYDTETGLYYLQSRYYNPQTGRFINADVFYATGQGLVGNNMFAYCLNNPICMADYVGEDAVYVVDYKEGRGLPIVGHAYVYIQDADGNWYKTEYTGQFPDKTTAIISVQKVKDFTEIEKILENQILDDKSYVYLSGDFTASLTYAQMHAGSNYGGYCLLHNNCMHYARDVLLEGTFDNFSQKVALDRYNANVPRGLYNYLKQYDVMSQIGEAFRKGWQKGWNAVKGVLGL